MKRILLSGAVLVVLVGVASLAGAPTSAAPDTEPTEHDVEKTTNSRRAFGFDENPERVQELLQSEEGRKHLDLYGVALTDDEARELGDREAQMKYVLALVEALRGRDDYALAYMDHQGGGVLTVSLTEGSALTEAELREIGKIPAEIPLRIRFVTYSEKMLQGAHDALISRWGEISEIAGTTPSMMKIHSIDNRIQVRVDDGSDTSTVERNLETFVANAGYPVDVHVTVGEPIQPFSTVVGGTRINSAAPNSCSTGPQVYGDTIYGRMNYTLTAWHCSINAAGAASNNWEHYYPHSHNLNFVAMSPSPGSLSQADVQILFTGVSGTSAPAIYNYSESTNWPVVDKSSEGGYGDLVGNIICKSGYAGGTSCGTLSDTAALWTEPWPWNASFWSQREVAGMTGVGGDSGGAVWGFHLWQPITTATGTLVGGFYESGQQYAVYSHIDRAYAVLAAQGAPFTVLL